MQRPTDSGGGDSITGENVRKKALKSSEHRDRHRKLQKLLSPPRASQTQIGFTNAEHHEKGVASPRAIIKHPHEGGYWGVGKKEGDLFRQECIVRHRARKRVQKGIRVVLPESKKSVTNGKGD